MTAPGAHWIIEPPPAEAYDIGSTFIERDTRTDAGIFEWERKQVEFEHLIGILVLGGADDRGFITYDLEKKNQQANSNLRDGVLDGFGNGWNPKRDGNHFFSVRWEGNFKTVSYYRLVGFPIPQKWKKITYPIFSGMIRIFRRRTGEELGRVHVKAMVPEKIGYRITQSHTGRFLFWEDRSSPEHPKIFVFREEKPAVLATPRP